MTALSYDQLMYAGDGDPELPATLEVSVRADGADGRLHIDQVAGDEAPNSFATFMLSVESATELVAALQEYLRRAQKEV